MAGVHELEPGDPTRIAVYELSGRLSEGGQGVIYLAKEPKGAEVALLRTRPMRATWDGEARQRFVRELSAIRRVGGFCTVRVLDADVDGDQPYIVSEYVPGPSLQEAVTGVGPLTGTDLDRLAVTTATALTAIHRAGIAHRDFSPANVLMGPDGPRVTGFGIARALEAAGTTAPDGTPAYMAPEQVSGQPIGTPADVFAWGVTMVFAATGRPAFGNDPVPE